MKGLDTNVLIRYLVADEPAQTERAAEFIETTCTRDDPGFLNRIVLCELVWVLRGAYGYRREEIAVPLKKLLQTAEFRVEDPHAAWNAVRLYEAGQGDFADAYLAYANRAAGCETTVTFDRKASRLEGFEAL